MAPDTYLTKLLADGARPFQYRSRVRVLLGLPADEGPPLVASRLPVAAFTGAPQSHEPCVPGRAGQERGTSVQPQAEPHSVAERRGRARTGEPVDSAAACEPIVHDIAEGDPEGEDGDRPVGAHSARDDQMATSSPVTRVVDHFTVPGRTARPLADPLRQTPDSFDGLAPSVGEHTTAPAGKAPMRGMEDGSRPVSVRAGDGRGDAKPGQEMWDDFPSADGPVQGVTQEVFVPLVGERHEGHSGRSVALGEPVTMVPGTTEGVGPREAGSSSVPQLSTGAVGAVTRSGCEESSGDATDCTAAVPATATRPSSTALERADSGTVSRGQGGHHRPSHDLRSHAQASADQFHEPYVRGAYALAPAGEPEKVDAAEADVLTSRRRQHRVACTTVPDASETWTRGPERQQSPDPGASRFAFAAEECVVIGRPPAAATAHEPCPQDAPVVVTVGERAIPAPNLGRTPAFWERRHISRFCLGILR